jgi:protein phosphatase
VGDSRLYRLRHGELEQVSEDHNLVAELVAEGRLSKEEAEFHPRRNIMTRALGVDPEVPVDLFEIDAQPGDRYLLCSDGLSDRVNDNLLASLLRRLADPAEAAAELVDEANRRGGNDNITVVIVDVIDTEEKPQDGTSAATAVIPAVPAEEAAPATKPATKPKPPRRKRTRPVTVRVLAFLILLLLLLGVAAAGIAFYARAQYYVGFAGVRITIFQGQPGGLLWFKPTVRQTTQYTANDIESAAVFPLISGVKEPSLSAARQYVQNLISQEQQARAAATPPTTVAPHPTTTVARHPTTVPRRSTTSTTKKP